MLPYVQIFIILIPGVFSLQDEKCKIPNFSFSRDDAIRVILKITSFEECLSACQKEEGCHKFTWQTSTHKYFPNSCILFGLGSQEEPEKELWSNSDSGYKNCFCKNPTACLPSSDASNVLYIFPGVDDEASCEKHCNKYGGCRFYTWYAELHREKKFCALFSSCDNVDRNCKDCCTGSRSEEDHCSPTIYKNLTSPERRTKFEQEKRREQFYIDTPYIPKNSKSKTTPDWAGEGWYRVTGEAGTQLTKTAKPKSCGGKGVTTLLDLSDPDRTMGIQRKDLCLSGKYKNSYDDDWFCRGTGLLIKVQNCGDFMIYELPNMSDRYGEYVYCTE